MLVNFIAIAKSLRLKLEDSSYRLKAAYRSSRIVFDYVLIGLFIRIKSFTDGFSVSEIAYKAIEKNNSDEIQVSETAYKVFETQKSNEILITEAPYKTFNNAKEDQILASDSAYFTYQKETQDSVVHLADYLSSSVSKIFEDSLFCVDSVGKSSQLVISDIIGLSDSGILLSQDYVDNMYYFASDYVGEKRIF